MVSSIFALSSGKEKAFWVKSFVYDPETRILSAPIHAIFFYFFLVLHAKSRKILASSFRFFSILFFNIVYNYFYIISYNELRLLSVLNE